MTSQLSFVWSPDLSLLPHEPGVYVYKDAPEGVILYIGKAKNIRKRVSQYFQRSVDRKTALLLSKARHIDWIITPSEIDALLLEAKLIRQHRPRYNIDLKENQRHAFIQITSEKFPRLLTVRNATSSSENVIGPFPDGSGRSELVLLARKTFRLRACAKMPKRVCLYYHLGQCSGPCENHISQEDYLSDVRRAKLLLRGQSSPLLHEMEQEMHLASKQLRFEEARRLRDAMRAVHHTVNKQIVARKKQFDEDVIVSKKLSDSYVFLILHVVKGIIARTEEFSIPLDRVDLSAPMDDFLKTFYQENAIPEEIIIGEPLIDEVIEGYLRNAKQPEKFRLTVVGKNGQKRALLDLAEKNLQARISKTESILVQLQEALRLPTIPIRIDAFDNSHLQGTDTVSACVHFLNGKPHKPGYRKFIIRDAKNNDVLAMSEAVTRKYRLSGKKDAVLPDLILIDGGKTQLHSAVDALQSLGLRIPVIGLAKKNEEIYVPGLPTPLPLAKSSEPSLFLQSIRNEIHRFVLSFHRSRRAKRQVASSLLAIPGIGERTATKLLRVFGSLHRAYNASDDHLLTVLTSSQLVAFRNHRGEFSPLSEDHK